MRKTLKKTSRISFLLVNLSMLTTTEDMMTVNSQETGVTQYPLVDGADFNNRCTF